MDIKKLQDIAPDTDAEEIQGYIDSAKHSLDRIGDELKGQENYRVLANHLVDVFDSLLVIARYSRVDLDLCIKESLKQLTVTDTE